MSTFYQYTREFPPILVRLLARRKNGPPLTTQDIAWHVPSMLTDYEINTISQCTDWDSVPFGKMHAFLVGCGMDFTDPVAMNRKKTYLRSAHKFGYLRKSPEFETILKPLIARYRDYLANKLSNKPRS